MVLEILSGAFALSTVSYLIARQADAKRRESNYTKELWRKTTCGERISISQEARHKANAHLNREKFTDLPTSFPESAGEGSPKWEDSYPKPVDAQEQIREYNLRRQKEASNGKEVIFKLTNKKDVEM